MIIIARLYLWTGFVQVRCVYSCLAISRYPEANKSAIIGGATCQCCVFCRVAGKKNVIREDWFAARNMFSSDGIHVCTENTNEAQDSNVAAF